MRSIEEAKKEAERTVSDELANQPKDDDSAIEESKEKRAEAEKKLKDTMAADASTN